MEMIFPSASGYQAAFLMNYRKQPGGSAIEQTGTVVLKRAYTIAASSTDASAGKLTPTAALPVNLTDQPADGPLRYEHDVAAFKPEGDIIVLGFSGNVGQASVTVSGQVRLARILGPIPPPLPDLFGWEPRTSGTRVAESDFENDPLAQPLPVAFQNRFFNGYLRDARVPSALPYLGNTSPVMLDRAGTGYGFTLGNETVTARYEYYKGNGADDDCAWLRRPVMMARDTLVIEPDANKCYVTWRGAWPFEEQNSADYRRLVVEATE
jgi:hypothetical protein